MGPALMNECNSSVQAAACLKRRGRGRIQDIKTSGKQRCSHSDNLFPSSSVDLQNKNAGPIELYSCSDEEDINVLKKHLKEKNDVHRLEDDIDLGYKIFLEHLREHGKSYVFEMSYGHDGKTICVEYEEEDSMYGDAENPLKRKSDECLPLILQDVDILPSKERRDDLCNNQKLPLSILSSHGKKESASSDSSQTNYCSSTPADNQFGESLVDEAYQKFLNHVRLHGHSMVLELEDGIKFIYEDEIEGHTISGGVDEKKMLLKRKCHGERSQVWGHFDSSLGKRKKVSHCTKNLESYMSEWTCLGKHQSSHDEFGEKEQKPRILDVAYHAKNRLLSCKSGRTVPSSYSGCTEEAESLVDSSYKMFLDHVRLHGHSLIFELKNGFKIVYEQENEVSAASEIDAPKATLICVDQELESERYSLQLQPCDSLVNVGDVEFMGNHRCSNSYYPFEEELMACLNKPFDWKELDKLLRDVKAQKKLERQKELRNKSKSYMTDISGKSYLEYFPDLAKKIKDADPHTTLTLLRHFFFWLEHLAHDGVKPPWIASTSEGDAISLSSDEMAGDEVSACNVNFEQNSVKQELVTQAMRPIHLKVPECLIKEEIDIS